MSLHPPARIAGLDLSTARVGYADPSGDLLSISGHAGPEDPYRRLHELARAIERTMVLRPPFPDLVVVEDYSLASPGRLSLVRLGEVGGVVRMRLFELGIPTAFVPPSSVKRFATGNGNATKAQMITAAIERGARGSLNDDEADAFHLRRMGRAAHGLEHGLSSHELDAISALSW